MGTIDETRILAVIVLALALLASCSGGNNDTVCSCPLSMLVISVPADRASNVKSVTATGACEKASALSVGPNGTGTCHIAVTFKSGASEYDTDVAIVPGPSPCECPQVSTSSVAVPELDGGEGGDQ